MSGEGFLETIRFGSRDADARDNFDRWSGYTSSHEQYRLGTVFRAEASFWVLDQIVVSEQRIDGFGGRRTLERLAAAPTRQVTFAVLLDGGMNYRSDGRGADSISGPGDVVLLDLNRVYDFEVHGGHNVIISMERGTIEDEIGPLMLEGQLPRTPETSMVADFTGILTRRLPAMRKDSAAQMAAVLRRLIVAAVRCGHVAAGSSLRTDRAVALAYIEEQQPGSLDVPRMLAELGMKRATLYRLFKEDGGVHAYDRRRRLRLLHLSLIDRDVVEPLGSLGARFGFFDLGGLSRQFKAQFGLSMTDVRRHLQPTSTRHDVVKRYRDAIERFV